MKTCKGKSCSSVTGSSHSKECVEEHNDTVFAGAGSRHPEMRYRGYKCEACPLDATEDQEAAWWEGFNARAYGG